MKEVESLFQLGAAERYGHLVRRVADFEEAWGLRSERGWSALTDDEGKVLFPLWPHPEYAEQCRHLGDPDDAPASISLEHLLNVLLPQFEKDGTLIAAFPTPAGKGIPVAAERLREDLLRESEQYEGEA
jgi:hypothetical protein